MKMRRRFKQTSSLENRLLSEADRLRDAAKLIAPGPVQDEAMHKARQMEAAAGMSHWLAAPVKD